MSEPRSVRQIAERFFALELLAQRMSVENSIAYEHVAAGIELERITDWAREIGIERYLEPAEKERVSRPLGGWPEAELVKRMNSNEAVGTLLWSLCLVERLPSGDDRYSWDEIAAIIHPLDDVEDTVRRARRRSFAELRQAYEAASAWAWRIAVGRMKFRSATEETEWSKAIEKAAATALARGYIAETMENDFAVGGKPFAALDKTEYWTFALLIAQRYAALLWIHGLAPDWVTAERMGLDAELPARPPSIGSEEVACRALALGFLLSRQVLEEAYRRGNEPRHLCEDAAAEHRTLLARLRERNVEAGLSPNERDLVFRPLGLWTEQERKDTSWRSEALGSLLWALSLVDGIPSYDDSFGWGQVLEATLGRSNAPDFIAHSQLRSLAAITKTEDAARLWVWRTELEQLRRLDRRNEAIAREIEEKLPVVAASALRAGIVPALIDGDLPAYGTSVALLDDRRLDDVYSRARERHLAFAWLRGGVVALDEGHDPILMPQLVP